MVILKEKILLLNPPGKKLYIRDYYCSKVSQANYINHPIDLLLQSGYLSQQYEIRLIDAIVKKMNREECLKEIENSGAKIILSLTGAVSWEEDIEFFRELKKSGQYRIILTGDIIREEGQEKLKAHPEIEALLLNFSTDDLLRYLTGCQHEVRNIIFRDGESVNETPLLTPPANREYNIPIPRHELFLKLNYRHPFVRQRYFTTILTDFGCPFKCSFCIMGTLGFKFRSVENVLSELSYIHSLGIRELLFLDQSFGAVKERNQELCRQMINRDLIFGWLCFSRADLIDKTTLNLMKQAGCHTIILGVESGSEEILSKYRKGYTKEQVKETFKLCRQIGIKTVGTFIIGLPEETEVTARETLEFIKDLTCDFASFNVAVPRRGTEIRSQALEEGLINNDFDIMDQSGTTIAMSTKYLSREQVLAIRRQAVCTFYLRPSYILRRIKSIDSYFRLANLIYQGLSMLKRTWLEKIK